MKRFLACLLLFCLMLTLAPRASAYQVGEPWHFDLAKFISNEESRLYVETMLDHHLRTNAAVRQTLKDGYVALFFFEGCSDNMDDPELSDISYYRVSATCVGVKLNDDGEPYLIYINENCSTLPDRPLEYGAWSFADVGWVGPATVCDGTYELYSVRHGGVYEALQLRTSEEDESIEAVYMYPDGFVINRATAINIHTRNVNHTIRGAMWSAGCILVGDGEFNQFTELMASSYYAVYDKFDLGRRVGTVTIDRQKLKDKLYPLYRDDDAVDRLLASSRRIQPEMYLKLCDRTVLKEEGKHLQTIEKTKLMTLPCSNVTDARSITVLEIPKNEDVLVKSCIKNPLGNLWYEVEYNGQQGYLYSSYVDEPTAPSWFEQFWDNILS